MGGVCMECMDSDEGFGKDGLQVDQPASRPGAADFCLVKVLFPFFYLCFVELLSQSPGR